MARAPRQRRSGQRGQASVELLATLPALLLVGAAIWQLALAGQTAWLCANAARAAARAALVGRSARAAARSALPRSLSRGMEVETHDGGAVRVRLRVPLLLAGHLQTPVRVGATARLGDGG